MKTFIRKTSSPKGNDRSPESNVTTSSLLKNPIETKAPISNSSELLCLSWLPATLMMIPSKMNELAWRHHFPIISLWEFFFTLKGSWLHSQCSGLSRPKFKLVRKYKKDRIKNNWETEKRWRHHFLHYKSTGVFCCHGNQSFAPSCRKILCSLSPSPMMLHIKFDQDWQLASEIFKFNCVKFSSLKGK